MNDTEDFKRPGYMAGIKRSNLLLLARTLGGFQFANPDKPFFPYTSGEIGNYYVQAGVVMSKGPEFRSAMDSMEGMIRITLLKYLDRDFEFDDCEGFVSGGESRDWIFSIPIADRLQLPHMMIYKDGKVVGFGADKFMFGMEGIHVADLNNEGSSVRDLWLPKIKELGGRLSDVFFYVDRMEDGAEVMKELGLRRHAVVELDGEAWQYLQDWGIVSAEQYKSLMERMEDKGSWARRTLRTTEGIRTLAGLLIDPRTRTKGEKILNVGYPDMREELRESLTGAGVEFADVEVGRLIVRGS